MREVELKAPKFEVWFELNFFFYIYIHQPTAFGYNPKRTFFLQIFEALVMMMMMMNMMMNWAINNDDGQLTILIK